MTQDEGLAGVLSEYREIVLRTMAKVGQLEKELNDLQIRYQNLNAETRKMGTCECCRKPTNTIYVKDSHTYCKNCLIAYEMGRKERGKFYFKRRARYD